MISKTLCGEFILQNSISKCQENHLALEQKSSVFSFSNDFRNIFIATLSIVEEERLDKFCAGLKPQIRLEALKAGPEEMDTTARNSPNVDSAIHEAGMFTSGSPSASGPADMNIGNAESRLHYRGKALKGRRRDLMPNLKDKDTSIMIPALCVTRSVVDFGSMVIERR